jgi:hypothetical protein
MFTLRQRPVLHLKLREKDDGASASMGADAEPEEPEDENVVRIAATAREAFPVFAMMNELIKYTKQYKNLLEMTMRLVHAACNLLDVRGGGYVHKTYIAFKTLWKKEFIQRAIENGNDVSAYMKNLMLHRAYRAAMILMVARSQKVLLIACVTTVGEGEKDDGINASTMNDAVYKCTDAVDRVSSSDGTTTEALREKIAEYTSCALESLAIETRNLRKEARDNWSSLRNGVLFFEPFNKKDEEGNTHKFVSYEQQRDKALLLSDAYKKNDSIVRTAIDEIIRISNILDRFYNALAHLRDGRRAMHLLDVKYGAVPKRDNWTNRLRADSDDEDEEVVLPSIGTMVVGVTKNSKGAKSEKDGN